MNQQKVAIIFYVVVSTAVIIVLSILLSRKKKKCKCISEGFRKCICSSRQGGRERECQDTETVNNLYVENKLTEFSKLPDKDWEAVSPGDIEFPISQGCNWPNSTSSGKAWPRWDFTEFGS